MGVAVSGIGVVLGNAVKVAVDVGGLGVDVKVGVYEGCMTAVGMTGVKVCVGIRIAVEVDMTGVLVVSKTVGVGLEASATADNWFSVVVEPGVVVCNVMIASTAAADACKFA